MFYVSAVRLPKAGQEGLIQQNGDWVIPVKDAWEIEFLREDAKRIAGR
jgi:hypothetical protein